MPRSVPTEDTAPRGEPGDYEEIAVPNKLLTKIGPGHGANQAAIDRADQIVERMKGVYEARLQTELENLLAEYEEMRASKNFNLDDLHDKLHEIRGEAGTFGYDLVSDIGKLLCEMLVPIGEVRPNDDRAIHTHIKAMHTVVAQKVTGAGPEVAKQIVRGLTTIVDQSKA